MMRLKKELICFLRAEETMFVKTHANPGFRMLISVSIFLPLLVSCSKAVHVVVFNVTEQDVLVSYKSDKGDAVSEALEADSSVRVRGLLGSELPFSIRGEGRVYNYKGEWPPASLVEQKGVGPFFRREVKVALEKDFCIYLVGVGEAILEGRGTSQPEGFPICPEETR